MQLEMENGRLLRCREADSLVLVPHTVREIAGSAFANCTEVEQLVLPNTLERVYDFAFSGCVNLRQVSLHAGVRLRAYGIFQNCPRLAGIVVRRGGFGVQIPIPMEKKLHDRFLVQLSLLLSEPDPDMQAMVLFPRMQSSIGKLGTAVYLTFPRVPTLCTEPCVEYLQSHRRQLGAYLAAGGIRMCLYRR